MKKIKIYMGQPYPLGASVQDNGINFSMVNASEEECGIIFYRKGVEQKGRILLTKNIGLAISAVFLSREFPPAIVNIIFSLERMYL